MEKNDIIDNYLKNARLIRLAKSANGYLTKPILKDSSNEYIHFYTFGFFDILTYIIPNENSHFTYRNFFGINPLYKNSEQDCFSSDQMFCVYDPVIVNNFNPFEYNGKDLPFLGLILITINSVENKSFKSLIEQTINMLKCELRRYNTDSIGIYKTLNCADICIVVRTDIMKHMFEIVSVAKNKFVEEKIDYNVTAIQCVTLEANGILDNKENLFNKNKSVKFDLRTIFPMENSQGILGIGRYTTRISFKKYFEDIYINFIESKFISKTCSEAHKLNIVHERLVFYRENETPSKENNINCDYNKRKMRDHQVYYMYINSLKEQINKLEDICKSYIGKTLYLDIKYKFMENLTYLKELVHSFSDLWFQYSPVNGYFLYVQLSMLISGINNNIRCISGASESQKRYYGSMLIKNMHKSVVCINNYNETLQFLNQDSVNYPSHEILSKINTEKYLLAYTAYLQSICNKFYFEYRSEGRRRILPIALFDINAERISSFTLFDKVEKHSDNDEEKNFERAFLYAVVFPNYNRFANIRHVLPVLTHEISHQFRYMSRKERNGVIIREYLLKDLSMQIANGMLKEAKVNIIALNGILTVFAEALYETIYNIVFTKEIENEFNKLHLHEIVQKFVSVIKNAFIYNLDGTIYLTSIDKNKENTFRNNIHNICNWLCKKEKNMAETERKFLKEENGLYKEFFEKLNDDNKIGEIDKANIKNVLSILFEYCIHAIKYEYKEIYTKFIDELYSNVGEKTTRVSIFNIKLFSEGIQSYFKKYVGKTLNKECNENSEEMAQDREKAFNVREFCTDMYTIMDYFNIIGKIYDFTYPKESTVSANFNKIFTCFKKNLMDEKFLLDFKLYISSENASNIFTTLGLWNSKPDIFVSTLGKIFVDIDKNLHKRVEDRINAYNEICADLGMCAAFRFSAFGYLRFLSHIFFQERNNDFWQAGKSFTADRVNTVIKVLLSVDNEESSVLKDCFIENKNNLIIQIENYIFEDKIKVHGDAHYADEINNNKDNIENFYNSLNIKDITYPSDRDEIYKHLCKLYHKNIKKARWIEFCHENLAISKIGKYYNSNPFENFDENQKEYNEFFKYHIGFVLDNYCLHRDMYNNLIYNILQQPNKVLTLKECMDILYNREEN